MILPWAGQSKTVSLLFRSILKNNYYASVSPKLAINRLYTVYSAAVFYLMADLQKGRHRFLFSGQ